MQPSMRLLYPFRPRYHPRPYFGFDFGGVYDSVRTHESIAYIIGDGRKVEINFTARGTETKVVETFEAESQNSIEMQHDGWRAILNNFKKYAETRS